MRERELLQNGLAELGLELTEHDRKRVLIYLDLLQ